MECAWCACVLAATVRLELARHLAAATGSHGPPRIQFDEVRGWRWRNVFHATGLTGWQREALAEEEEAGSAASVAAAGSQQELAMLRQQADGLAAALDEIRQRIEEIQGQRPTPEPVVEQADG